MEIQSYCFTANEVFESRNKSYGAYLIRKFYEPRVLLSLLAGIILFSIFILSIYAASMKKEDKKEEVKIKVDLKNIQPPPSNTKTPPPPPVEPPPPPKVAMEKFLPPEVTEKETEAEEFKSQEDLENKVAGEKTQEGNTTEVPPTFDDSPGEETKIVETPDENQVFTAVEQTADFPGGTAELQKFLAENIKYPKQANRMGIEGRVIAQFVVEKDGSITDARVLKGIGGGCDEEALRVVQMMPRWSPAKQNGRPVRYKQTLPVVFRLRK